MNNMDDQYLKMVLALPDEFVEGWEWKEGDHGIITWPDFENNEILITNIRARRFEFRCVESGTLKITFDFRGARPIPSQEQLQKKCIDFENVGKRYTDSNYFSISKRFIAVVIEGDLVKNIEEKTLNEMWLEFTEYVIYGKTWDGEAWV